MYQVEIQGQALDMDSTLQSRHSRQHGPNLLPHFSMPRFPPPHTLTKSMTIKYQSRIEPGIFPSRVRNFTDRCAETMYLNLSLSLSNKISAIYIYIGF